MSPGGRNPQQSFPEININQPRQQGAIDRIKKKGTTRPQYATDLSDDPIQIGNMLEHVNADNMVHAGISEWQMLACADKIAYR